MLFNFALVSAKEEGIRLLHCNLFDSSMLSIKDYGVKKENLLRSILTKTDVAIFSVLDSRNNKKSLGENVFQGDDFYGVKRIVASHLEYSLFFDKSRVNVLSSQNYESLGVQFFYLQLETKDVATPIHFIVYKEDVSFKQYREILKFLDSRKIKNQVVILGGKGAKARLKKEGNLVSFMKMTLQNAGGLSFYDVLSDGMMDKEQDFSFLFVSSDIWEESTGALKLKRQENYFDKELYDELKMAKVTYRTPLSFLLEINEKETQQTIYATPQVEIISQDKENLRFSVIWDEDEKLNIEILSMIGNVFLSQDVKYVGNKEEYTITIKDFPTGIYLLKVVGEDGHMVIRKFTKY